MDAEAVCILCNWVNDAFWPYGPFGAFGAGAAAAAAGGLFGGSGGGDSGGGDSDDASSDETDPRGDFDPNDPWGERKDSEEYNRELEADRLKRWDDRRQREADRPWSGNTLLDVSEMVQTWTQELFGMDPDNPEGKGTAPGTSKA